MWFSCILQAVNDALLDAPAMSEAERADSVWGEAVAFLTDMSPSAWAASKNICEAVGLDGDRLRAFVIGVLEGAPLPEGAMI